MQGFYGYGGKKLCGECHTEYRMMLEGVLSKKAQKRIEQEKNSSNDPTGWIWLDNSTGEMTFIPEEEPPRWRVGEIP